jgi:c-di-GMP-binding flagellar brake protein YcgR
MTNLTFEVVQAISHVTHDWDFSGPHNLVVHPSQEDFSDFRVFHRIQIRVPITLQLPPAANPVIVRGFSCDLSAGGVGAVFQQKLASGYRSGIVRIGGRGAAALSLSARFRHQSGLRYGFEFTRMAAAEKEAIRRLIENYRKTAAATGVA